MEGQTLEEPGWYYGSSDSQGGSERCCTRSEAERALEGSALYELRLGVFCTQHQSPYFQVRVLNEGSTEKFFTAKVTSLDFRTWLFLDILAFGALVLEPFRKRFFRNSRWSAALGMVQ